MFDVQYGHSLVVNPAGEILAEADENEATIYADIGKSTPFPFFPHLFLPKKLCWTGTDKSKDIDMLEKTRSGIPVTVQRRFDVYPDVAKA